MTKPVHPGSRNKRGGATVAETENYNIRVKKEIRAAEIHEGKPWEDRNFFPLNLSDDRRFAHMPWVDPHDVPRIPITRNPNEHDTRKHVMGVDPQANLRAIEEPHGMTWQKVGSRETPQGEMVETRHGFKRTALGGYYTDGVYNHHQPHFRGGMKRSLGRSQSSAELQHRMERGAQTARKTKKSSQYETRGGGIRLTQSRQGQRPQSARPRPMTRGYPVQHQHGIKRVMTPKGQSRQNDVDYIPVYRPQSSRSRR